MKISKPFKDSMISQFGKWLDENVKKDDTVRTSESDDVIVFQVIRS